MNDKRIIRAPTGTTLQTKSWLTEAPLRMLMNNLDPDVAERPEDLVVYGGIGKAAHTVHLSRKHHAPGIMRREFFGRFA